MSESMLLTVAVFVFVMMMIGLGLTVWEFRNGQPRLENKSRAAREETARGPHTAAVADANGR